MPQSFHPESRCRQGTEIVDGDLNNVFQCFTSGLIFIDPFNPFTYLAALAAGGLHCNGAYDENICVPNDQSGNVEVANGIDDNCDGVGLEDEFCDGIDNDGDGRVDEDAGSCALKFLAVPLCWSGTDAEFQAAVDTQMDTFITAAGLADCSDAYRIDPIMPSVANVPCPGLTASLDDIEATAEALPNVELADFDALVGITDQDLSGSVRGATDRSGRFWGESTVIGSSRPEIILAHEFGHIVGLDDEYCSTVAGGAGSCNSLSSVNALDSVAGCDPTTSSCCDLAHRRPGAAPGDYPDNVTACGGAYDVCCLGNSSVVDATASSVSNDPVGRCAMSSSYAPGPRRFCRHCLSHLRGKGIQCGTRHSGMKRLLEVKGIASPGPFLVLAYSFLDGRPGVQNINPQTNGDVVLEIVEPTSNSLIATRGVRIGGQTFGEELMSAETVKLRIPLPDSVAESDPIRLNTIIDGVFASQSTLNGSAPVVDAGPDQVVECQGDRAAIVNIDGSGSFDADGDTLSFVWSKDGVDFSDNGVESVQLGVGDHELTLAVSDNIDLRTDSVNVRVEDTTPPVLQIPDGFVTSDCSSPPLGEAFATDQCGEVIVTNDASSKFGLGANVVTWTAVDEAGNVTTAEQLVFTILADDPSCCPDGTNIIVGTGASEVLAGTGASDCILGLGGSDTIDAGLGDDFVSGGDGNDTIFGSLGSNYLVGGDGTDIISGGTQSDFIDGQGGYDICSGGTGLNSVSCDQAAHCTASCCMMSCALPLL